MRGEMKAHLTILCFRCELKKKKKGEEEIKVIVYGITAIDQVVFD